MSDDYDYENLRVTDEDSVRRVVIDSTSKMNTMNRAMIDELTDLFVQLEDDRPRCLVLTGSDGVFCGGGDVLDLGNTDAATPARGFRQGAAVLHDAMLHLHQAEVPVVTGVNGPAVGAGFSLALAGDYTLASDDAYFQYGYPKIGLTGDGGSTFYLPRTVGRREAKRLVLLNEQVDAADATERGLATEVVSEDEFDDRLDEVAGEIAAGPTVALGRTMRLLDESHARDMPSQLAQETQAMADCAKTDDHIEGITAFAEKREPEFTGE
ncbi:MAG: enoyl-CoA hydratase/isomerase family protein [Haloglomus sp.]